MTPEEIKKLAKDFAKGEAERIETQIEQKKITLSPNTGIIT